MVTNDHESASVEEGVPDEGATIGDDPTEGGSSSKENAAKDMVKLKHFLLLAIRTTSPRVINLSTSNVICRRLNKWITFKFTQDVNSKSKQRPNSC
jgi:hypothetical protein